MKQDIEWTCEDCGAENIDTYGETVEPMCEDCFHEPGWAWILEQPQAASKLDIIALLAPISFWGKEPDEQAREIKAYIEMIDGVSVRHVHPFDRNEQNKPFTWWVDAVIGGKWTSGLFIPGKPGATFPTLDKIHSELLGAAEKESNS